MPRIDRNRENSYETAFSDLLTHKHLYQSTTVDGSFVKHELANREDAIAATIELRSFEGPHRGDVGELLSEQNILRTLNKRATLPIVILTQSGSRMLYAGPSEIEIHIPNFETWCSTCELRKPFAVVAAASQSQGAPAEELERATIDQVFHLTCLCQACQKEHVHFMVRRKALKLTLVGRSPVEAVIPPPFIPQAVRSFYSNAVIGRNSGQTLAALFLLRTFIEQFWCHLGLRAENERISGEELGKRYARTLPDAIKSSFPSLAEHYELLSARIHEANADSDQFDRSLASIIEHFDARRLFKVPNDRGSCSAAAVSQTSAPSDE